MKHQPIEGFSKLSKQKKIDWLVQTYLEGNQQYTDILQQYWNDNADLQKLHEEFSENTISNFYMPYGIAPNFLIDGELKAIPMAVEESSVVAAASKSAKFWLDKGGFKTTVINEKKLGHTHFTFNGESVKLQSFFNHILRQKLFEDTDDITKNMRSRGGGILDIELVDKTAQMQDYYQLKASFNTKDSMGANFINSCLEQFGKTLKREVEASDKFTQSEKDSLRVIMNILSNFTPDCVVRAEVSCKMEDLVDDSGIAPEEFAWKFKQAVNIAEIEPYRATTHNKGIMNGVDAVVIATGNDFRATEACAHTYASKDGRYTSLTHCSTDNGIFRFWLDLPISVGVVGGLTNLHPLVKFSLALLGKPSATELMSIIAVSGLAQNFAALRSLVTTGIQKGHMKMHLFNILNQFGATEAEKEHFVHYFKDKTVSHHEVIAELEKLRGK
ncbi:hydroxymethylglutaryl-CoA reductase [Elizabethkingia meningoseptica]|uniref:Hydroxymethylglutaryl-CoA reductase n=3 Tax=Elizabethkingia meningoseptica TaxID=238 RepID=A0A1V3U5B2_ELIME|nr:MULTISPECIES: hydroxymethylglutaryl-CoA reductase [Elizabethkingia]AQX14176.1 hydroxymethylglutaryl-CoA reductase [Elizabethkingia meningoseptica]MBG0512639.1 hydroxymethylglutaryl-CoA reductase [Elizabethkingia meningoseptica]MDE5435241.1 hydroxymethylglutaryl-CoA reductase [Elizabethkingia meningoseptica]MDE5472119.1 hydroxymethylglutaryl-CoA reductase [Elizabethkingia meningoseptica]MDE5483088.1 hydroxymethylglutaryl-CoA reductase [Elizabethkingia meningoseptica]